MMDKLLLIDSKEPTREELILLFSKPDLLMGRTPFTSMLSLNGKIPFLDNHIERLKTSFLFMYPENSFEDLKSKIEKSLKVASKLKGDNYVRLTMIEGEETISLITQVKPYRNSDLKDIKLKTSDHPHMLSKLPNFLKAGNYLESSVKVNKAIKEGFTDCLFLNKEGICKECSTSNIFFRKGERFFTPALEGAVLDGITRRVVIEIIKEQNMNIQELEIHRSEWESMDEVFITNSLKGLVTVSQIDTRNFETDSDYFKKIKINYSDRMKK